MRFSSRTGITIVLILSVIIGLLVFGASEYKTSTLVMKVRTLEKGARLIGVTGTDNGKPASVTFEIGTDNGEPSVYAIELPRLMLGTVTIPPLAGEGKYQIDGLSLSTNAISYSWDERMACSQKRVGASVPKGLCSDNSPSITMAADATIVISSIPADGFVNPVGYRLTVALASALIVMLGGLYLLGRAPGKIWPEGLQQYSVRGAWLVIILLYGLQIYLLCTYAVDLPYYEEWEFFDDSALPGGLTWQWLSQQVSHQRMMVFTKLMAWLNFKLFSLDFIKLKIMNYAVFGCLLLAIVRFKNRVLGDSFPLFPLFLVFLVSPLVYEIHAASFQAGETFAVLCSVLMLLFVISNEPSWKGSLAFLFCAVASMCSLSAGLVYALVFLSCDTMYTVVNLQQKQIERAAGLRSIYVRWAVILSTALLWFHGFKKPGATWSIAPLLLPYEGKFWAMFLNLLGFGFGFDIESPFPGIVCLLLLVIPVIVLLKNKETRWKQATWQVSTALAGSLAVVALITIGRGNMDFSIKVSRYAIFGMLLIPYGAMAWWLALEENVWRLRVIGLLWCFIAITYYNDWDYGVYRDSRPQELLNLECVERYSNGTGDGVCPGSFVLPIGSYFDNAKRLGVQFTRQFTSPSVGR